MAPFSRRHSQSIFLTENVWIPIKISLKFVPKGPIYNIPAIVQIMAWRCPGDKPLCKPMMVSLPTHICVARPQWVNKWSQMINKQQSSSDHNWRCNTICISIQPTVIRYLPWNCLSVWGSPPRKMSSEIRFKVWYHIWNITLQGWF